MSTKTQDDWDDIELIEGCNNDNKDLFRKELERVRETGLGPWEISIMEAIWYDYGQVDNKQLLASNAFGVYLDKNTARAFAAIEKCFAEGWIHFLTTEFLEQIHQELVDGGYLIPNGLIGQGPSIDPHGQGLISYTKRGADLYHRWLNFDPADSVGHWCVVRGTDGFDIAYGTTLEESQCPIELDMERVIDMEPPIQIGRWCDRWWNRFERGYHIRYRTSVEW